MLYHFEAVDDFKLELFFRRKLGENSTFLKSDSRPSPCKYEEDKIKIFEFWCAQLSTLEATHLISS